MTYTNDQINQLQLFRTENIGPATFRQLIRKYGNSTSAIEALGPLSQQGGRKKPLKAITRNKILEEITLLDKIGGEFIFMDSEHYPNSLKNISDAPPVFAYLGHKHLLHKPQIAIVGARNASSQAQKLSFEFAKALGERHDFIITSGLARGIDKSAHQGAIKTGTIAVVAGGIDSIYPPENEKLYEEIKACGCIIAEAPFGIAPLARHFPRRNRLIAGISHGILVIEAAFKSGSLITARLAGEYGRDVFAVPGSPLDPRSRGCNALLKDGAIITETPEDIVNYLNQHIITESMPDLFEDFAAPEPKNENISKDLRKKILQLLSPSPCDIDSLIRDCEADTSQAITVLMELELAGKAERLPGNRIALSLEASWQENTVPF